MPFNPWNRERGASQGRVQPVNWTAQDGVHAFVLGSDAKGKWVRLKGGDYAEIRQSGNFGSARTLRIRARMRPPGTATAGATWRASFFVDGVEMIAKTLPASKQRDFVDLAWPVIHLANDHTIAFRLQLLGAPTTIYEVELPAIYLDGLALDTATPRLSVMNRDPEPGETGVPVDSHISLDIADVGVGSIDLAQTKVYVNGVLAFDAGTFQAGFNGAASAHSQPQSDMRRIAIDKTVNFGSTELVTVRAVSKTSDGLAELDTSWTFTTADIAAPTVVSAAATGKKTVRVTFDGPVVMTSASGANDALNQANYTFARTAGEVAVNVTAASVAVVTDRVVEITTNIELTRGGTYTVTAKSVADIAGNVMGGAGSSASFVAYSCPVPTGRDFDLWSWVPNENKREDTSGDLRKFIALFQEVVDLKLCEIDEWTNILDPDLAPEPFVDAILLDLGNPFDFALALIDKRRLASVLVQIYKQKGISLGIIAAIRFFMGIEVTIRVPAGTLGLGEWELGVDWELGTSDLKEKLTFEVVVPRSLTADERERMSDIVRYMQYAQEHFRLVEPAPPPAVPDHLELGISELGVTWDLH